MIWRIYEISDMEKKYGDKLTCLFCEKEKYLKRLYFDSLPQNPVICDVCLSNVFWLIEQARQG